MKGVTSKVCCTELVIFVATKRSFCQVIFKLFLSDFFLLYFSLSWTWSLAGCCLPSFLVFLQRRRQRQISRLVSVDSVFPRSTSMWLWLIFFTLCSYNRISFLTACQCIIFSSELELPNRDKTHINMSLEVLDILKVIKWVFRLKYIFCTVTF